VTSDKLAPSLADCHEPIHGWFELTYSSYLVVPRSILQSMPQAWQARFVACLEELRDAAPTDAPTEYWVRATDGKLFVRDPYSDYQRGRRRVELRSPSGGDE
jgi:hypothetical protein